MKQIHNQVRDSINKEKRDRMRLLVAAQTIRELRETEKFEYTEEDSFFNIPKKIMLNIQRSGTDEGEAKEYTLTKEDLREILLQVSNNL